MAPNNFQDLYHSLGVVKFSKQIPPLYIIYYIIIYYILHKVIHHVDVHNKHDDKNLLQTQTQNQKLNPTFTS